MSQYRDTIDPLNLCDVRRYDVGRHLGVAAERCEYLSYVRHTDAPVEKPFSEQERKPLAYPLTHRFDPSLDDEVAVDNAQISLRCDIVGA